MKFLRYPSERTLLILIFAAASTLAAAQQPPADATATLKQYCSGCHGKAPTAGISVTRLTGEDSWGEHWKEWEKVADVLEQKRMPPPKLPQPGDTQRAEAARWIRTRLNEYAMKHAGDPGKVTVRRLTTGEYTYSVNDLTGLDLKFDGDFPSDSVGGEGFASFGDVQFIDETNLERYLETAKRIANHAVIGAGPLGFFEHPGRSGLRCLPWRAFKRSTPRTASEA